MSFKASTEIQNNNTQPLVHYYYRVVRRY